MADHCNDPVSEVASEIIGYIESHPDASDSLSGIRDFWLESYSPPDRLIVLNTALDRLVSAGLLERTLLPGGQYIFRTLKVKSKPGD